MQIAAQFAGPIENQNKIRRTAAEPAETADPSGIGTLTIDFQIWTAKVSA